MRLAFDTLSRAKPGTHLPGFDPRRLGIGIAHLGCGAFMRGHQALATQRALAASPGDWGISAASLVSPATRDALAPQDGLYTLLTRDDAETGAEIIGALREVLFTRDDPAPFIARIATARIVTLTITEKGYCLDPATLRLDPAHPDIRHDLDAAAPRSAVGLLVAGLGAARRSGTPPPTVLSCDNLTANSAALRQAAIDFAALRDDPLARWIESSVRFPCTMVDRIVPATTGTDRDDAATLTGLEDAAPVIGETFLQWVIEAFDGPRPQWEAAGAEFVADVAPWEAAKLRLLNASHSALAYLGGLAGLETIGEAIAEPRLDAFVRRLALREAAPTLPPGGPDAAGYLAALLPRWRNRGIRHRTAQIAMDGSRKLPPRLIAPLRENVAAGRPIDCTALVIAAWMQWATGRDLAGRPIVVQDPLAAVTTQFAAAEPDALVDLFLAREDVFGAGFPARDALHHAMRALHAHGPLDAAGMLAR